MSKFYRINQYIQESKLRLIDADGSQMGVVTRDEALQKAKDAGLDLVEIAPNANPPVAKVIDFQKFRYSETKKERAARKGASDAGLKELWLSPRIADHDLNVRLNRAEKFLDEGHKVKLTVKFKGREMAHPENGRKVLDKALGHFEEKIHIDREAKFEGRNYSVIIGAKR